VTTPAEWAPPACTLPTAERPLRLAEFDDLFTRSVRSVRRAGPTHVTLTLAPAPGRADAVRDLARRETACCSFFAFQVEDADPLRLEITVPAAYAPVLDALADRAARLARITA
jgi:hypothetical protein